MRIVVKAGIDVVLAHLSFQLQLGKDHGSEAANMERAARSEDALGAVPNMVPTRGAGVHGH